MAFASTKILYNVNGKFRENTYLNCTLNSGDQLVTPMNTVDQIIPSPAGNFTSWTITGNGPGQGSTITFTLSAPVTGIGTSIKVIGN